MAAKGARWSDSEVETLLEIWADPNIQSQLDTTHKNSKVYGQVCDLLEARGYPRTIDQCRDKVKKLRIQYLRVRDSLRKSGSAGEKEEKDKDRFRWYDAVDQIIGLKPSVQSRVLESSSRLDNKPGAPSSDVPLAQEEPVSEPEAQTTSASTPESSTPPTPVVSRKRKRSKTPRDDMLEAFLNLQKKQHEDFMRAEQARHEREMEVFELWMQTQKELEGQRQHQTQLMFQRLMEQRPITSQTNSEHYPPSPNSADQDS